MRHRGFRHERQSLKDDRRPRMVRQTIRLYLMRVRWHLPPGRAGGITGHGLREPLITAVGNDIKSDRTTGDRPEAPIAGVADAPIIKIRRAGEDTLPWHINGADAIARTVSVDAP